MQTEVDRCEHLKHPDWNKSKTTGQSKGLYKKNEVKKLNQGLTWDKDSLQEMGQQERGDTLPSKPYLFSSAEEKATNVCDVVTWAVRFKL